MAQVQSDPVFKLFGKTIQLHPTKPSSMDQQQCHPSISLHQLQKEHKDAKGKDTSSHQCAEVSIDELRLSETNEDPKTPNAEKEISSTNTTTSEYPNEMSYSDKKTELKKPDKLLPCPRCNSMDTKFCYYNNYNVSQPRHFCKNCQRYWTAGGNMRNVPVGSGRRKNKSSSASNYGGIVVSDPFQPAGADALSFGSDAPLCESMATVLNLAKDIVEKEKSQNVTINEFHLQEERKGDGHSANSSNAVSNLIDKGQNSNLNHFQRYPLQVHCFPAPPWPYLWSPAQSRSPMTPSITTPFAHSGFPVSIQATPQYWDCNVPVLPAGPWGTQWLIPEHHLPGKYGVPSSTSSSLGKHSRDGNILTSSKLVNEQALEGTVNSIKEGSLFKDFEAKGDHKIPFVEKSKVLHAFNESTRHECGVPFTVEAEEFIAQYSLHKLQCRKR